jgi:methylated-DNA-[protein]-cysteine S-methyltransferase
MNPHQESYSYLQSPVGTLQIGSENGAISRIHFLDEEIPGNILPDPVHQLCVEQLREYFAETRKTFDFPMAQKGTDFRQRVWAELLNIPFGETISYLELSRRIGDVKAIRAVGSANGKNNIAIAVPCHRVIGSGNKLTGYAGGLWRKDWLLQHELKLSGVKEGMLF